YSKGIDHEQEHEHDYERELLSQHCQHIDAAIAVAPLVVIPADHFHETIAEREREFAVEDERMRVADDVMRDERIFAEFQYAVVIFRVRGRLERGVDRFG